MCNVNKVTLIGRLGADPEVKETPAGLAICEFSLATNYVTNNEKKTTWHSCTAFDGLAKKAFEQLKKGNLVYLEGRINYSQWTAADGTQKYGCNIVANELKKF